MIEILILISYLNKKNKIIISNLIFFLLINYFLTLRNLWINFSSYYFFIYQDKFRFSIIILNFWISRICIIISNKKKNFFILILIIIVNLCLRSSNIFIFYIFFEIRLIPLFIIVYWWGYYKERVTARIYILIYTILGSLPLFLSIVRIYSLIKRLEWFYLFTFNVKSNKIIYWNLIIAFLIKIPTFGLHTWLPKAHVQAPVFGSIILARIILKLGGIGLIRIILTRINKAIKFNLYLISFIIIGSCLIRFLCSILIDIKIIIAYSSIVHIGVATVSILTLNIWGYAGSIILIIGHGLSSSCLFYITNVIFLRSQTRITFLNKGLLNQIPSFIYLWFFACIRNLGAPLSLNFIRELIITNRILRYRTYFIIPLILINILRSFYSIQLFIYTTHGQTLQIYYPVKLKEFFICLLHIVPLNISILNPSLWIIF